LNTVISLINISEKEILLSYLKTYLLEIEQDTNYAYLDSYWTDVNRIPLKLTNGKDWLGFALINDYTIIPSNTISIAEFYILPEYRNQRLGSYFAEQIFKTYHGCWEIRQQLHNTRATVFWRSILKNNVEVEMNDEIVQSFTN
jgi:predicted acetyltransferase